MKDTTTKPNEYEAREKRNSLNFVFWSFAYGISLVLSSFALLRPPVNKQLLGFVAIVITVGIGIAALMSFIRLIKGLDERVRKIWLESIAMTFAVLWITFGCLVLLHQAEINLIDSKEIGLLSIIAGLGFASGGVRTIR